MSKKIISKQELINKIMFICGIVLCALLLPLLIINVTMIIKSYTNKDEVPSFGEYVPFIVLTDSMSGIIESGDVIICKKIDGKDVKKDMIIAFYDPAFNYSKVTTHKVIEVDDSNPDSIKFKTKGVANNTEDELWVPADKVIGQYKSTRIPLLGYVSYFMSTVPGLIVCVLLPLGMLVGYDVIKRKINDKNMKDDTAALLSELEALKAEKKALEEAKQTEINE